FDVSVHERHEDTPKRWAPIEADPCSTGSHEATPVAGERPRVGGRIGSIRGPCDDVEDLLEGSKRHASILPGMRGFAVLLAFEDGARLGPSLAREIMLARRLMASAPRDDDVRPRDGKERIEARSHA